MFPWGNEPDDGETDISSAWLWLLWHERATHISCAEINVDASDPVAVESKELCIPETLSVFCRALVGHKGPIAFHKDFFERMPFDPVAAAPTPRKVGGLVDRVIIRTGKPEFVVEKILNGLAIVRQVGSKYARMISDLSPPTSRPMSRVLREHSEVRFGLADHAREG